MERQNIRGRLLVMDDDHGVRRTLGMIMTRLGYDISFAADGKEALAIYKMGLQSGSPFDVVITDLINFGGMGGERTLAKLREIDPDAMVILMSGYLNQAAISDYKLYGFDEAISKPFWPQILSKKVDSLLLKKAGKNKSAIS